MNRLNFASLRRTVCLYGNVFGIAMFLSTVTRFKQTIYKWVKNLRKKGKTWWMMLARVGLLPGIPMRTLNVFVDLRYITFRVIAEEFDVSLGNVHSIVKNDL